MRALFESGAVIGTLAVLFRVLPLMSRRDALRGTVLEEDR